VFGIEIADPGEHAPEARAESGWHRGSLDPRLLDLQLGLTVLERQGGCEVGGELVIDIRTHDEFGFAYSEAFLVLRLPVITRQETLKNDANGGIECGVPTIRWL
jgi:hypothetical protein